MRMIPFARAVLNVLLISGCAFPSDWELAFELPPVAQPSRDIVHGGETELVLRRPGLFAVHFADEDHGWAVGSAGTISRTADGGRTWSQDRYELTCLLNAVHFVSNNDGWIAGECRGHALLLRTRNGGAQWRRINVLGRKGITFNDVWFLDEKRGWIAGVFLQDDTEQGVILATQDGGSHWHIQYRGEVYGNPLRAVRFADAAVGWAVGDFTILHTADGGRSWTEQLEPKRRDPFLAVEAISPKEAWVVGRQLLHTLDGGITWSEHRLQAPSTHRQSLSSIRFSTPEQGWVGASDGGIFSTSDGGRTWRRENLGRERYVSGLWTFPRGVIAVTADGDILYGIGVDR